MSVEIQQIPAQWPSWMKPYQIKHLVERREKQLKELGWGQKVQPIPEKVKPVEVIVVEEDIVEQLKRENRMLKRELKNVYERLSKYEQL